MIKNNRPYTNENGYEDAELITDTIPVVFLRELSKKYPNDMILPCCDGAAWHKSKGLVIPENIELFFIPPYTPEMNPIEQIWKEIRKLGFQERIICVA